MTVHVDQIPGLEDTSMSVQVRSDERPAAGRRTHDVLGRAYYGGHTGTAVEQPRRRWFFAEGSQGFFDTFVLVTNANPIAGRRHRDVPARGRHAGRQDDPGRRVVARRRSAPATIRELADRSFGMIVDATQPVIAERAMYFGTTPTRLWSGGHDRRASRRRPRVVPRGRRDRRVLRHVHPAEQSAGRSGARHAATSCSTAARR